MVKPWTFHGLPRACLLIISFGSFGGVKECLNTLATFGMSAFVLRSLEMSRFKAEAKKMVEVLEMKWAPIAGKFWVDAEETGDSARSSASVKPSMWSSVRMSFSLSRRRIAYVQVVDTSQVWKLFH